MAYPSVDLSHFPEREKYSARLEEDFSEFVRLREQVRPLVPPGALLTPGTKFGPFVGAARGEFGPLCLHNPWTLLIRPEPLEHLAAAASLPSDLDLFRMKDMTTMIIATERFVDAVRSLGYEQDIDFRELPLR